MVPSMIPDFTDTVVSMRVNDALTHLYPSLPAAPPKVKVVNEVSSKTKDTETSRKKEQVLARTPTSKRKRDKKFKDVLNFKYISFILNI
jgi:hypothetical protein